MAELPREPADVGSDSADGLAADERVVADYGAALAEAIRVALPVWVQRCVSTRAAAAGMSVDPAVIQRAAAACSEDVGTEVQRLLSTDIDRQRGTPLTLLRGAVRYPTGVLADARVPAVVRDEFSERSFPDDVYDLAPASFADISEDLVEPGLAWGAAKAHVHLRRRRAQS